MNSNDVDALSGRELRIAIAEALGWQRKWGSSTMWVAAGQSIPFIFFPDWPTDIAAAWELDGAGWRWHSDDRDYYLPGDIKVMRVWTELSDYRVFEGFAEWVNLEDKSSAYAVARCRAWLKARRAGVAE